MLANWLSNRVFKSSDIVDHSCSAWNTLVDPALVDQSIAGRDWSHRAVGWNVTIRSRPRGSPVSFMLREHLLQAFHPGGRDGDGLLVIRVVDPEAAVLRLHVRGDRPQQRLVLAEGFGGAADGDGVGLGRHGQAARAAGAAQRQFQGNSATRSVILCSAIRASTSASQAWGLTSTSWPFESASA